MGGKNEKPEDIQNKLPKAVQEKVLKLFNLIDIDNSKTIDREETLKFWAKNFARINSNELFEQVDKNNDGTIQLEEWLEFWAIVMKSGYTEEEVTSELDNMMEGGSWVKFETTEKMGKRKEGRIKKEGKY